MSAKKLGRRSAQAAEETKLAILNSAGSLFCQLGYERVSLRNISEHAGVSHSLIRHHFGSKEHIWFAVSDALHAFISEYIQQLIHSLPQDKPAKVQLYQFMVRLLALLLIEPRPNQFVADTVRQEGKFIDYFLDRHGAEEQAVIDLREKYNTENPHRPVDMLEIKWLLMNSAHAAATLKPMLNIIWKEQAGDPELILYNHWDLFNKQMIALFAIEAQEYLHPKSLQELVLPYQCELKPC